MTDIHHPHDLFFSTIFERMDIAEDILISNIPQLAELIEPGTMEHVSDQFVNAKLIRYVSDLLLKAKLKNGKEAYIYLLLEHKSYHDPRVALALLRYMIEIWWNEQTKPLPFVFPVVIYHGSRSWNSDTNFSSLIQIPAGMDEYTPHFEYYLLDLSQYSDEEIKGSIYSRTTLLLFKHIFANDFGDRFLQICTLLAELHEQKSALEYMKSVLEYIGNATDKISSKQIAEGVKIALPLKGEKLMPTVFEKLREEGRQEGRHEGWQEGRQEGQQEGMEQGRDIGLLEGLRQGIQLALELKFEAKGENLYRRIQDVKSLPVLHVIEDGLRKNASLADLERILNESATKK